MAGLTYFKTLYRDDFGELTDGYWCNRWGDFFYLTEGVANFLKKKFSESVDTGYKWLAV